MNSAEQLVVQNKEVSLTGFKQELSTDECLTKLMGVEVHPTTLKDKFLFATFQIIAENGADALSANELIRKTESSKGALFHHFKTLDELCLESLRYFRKNASFKVSKPHNSLSEFIQVFVEDMSDRFSGKAYFHVAHFYRDRALKDEKFKAALNETYAAYIDNAVDDVLKYLAPNAKRNHVREMVIFLFLSLERVSFRLITSNQPSDTQDTVQWFVKMVTEKLSEQKA